MSKFDYLLIGVVGGIAISQFHDCVQAVTRWVQRMTTKAPNGA